MAPPRVSAVSLVSLAALLGGAQGVAGATVPRFSAPVQLRVGANPSEIVAADVNGDGKPDLATADYGSSTLSVASGRGDGSFRRRTTYRTPRRPAGITAADIDGDRDLDLVSASSNATGAITVFWNRGSGRFRRGRAHRSGARAYAVAAADVDHDGSVDLVTANNGRRDFAVLLGTGAGRFLRARRYRGPGTSDVAVGDFNGDGNVDVALATSFHTDSVVVRLGRGDGTFGPARGYESGSDAFGVTVAEFNHDHKLDIVVANYDGSSVSVFLGIGDGTFGARNEYPMGFEPYEYFGGVDPDTVVVGDFDRDGHLDIAAPRFFTPVLRRGRGDGTFGRQQDVSIDRNDPISTVGGAVADFNRDGWPDLAFNDACDYLELPYDCPATSASVFLNWTAKPAPPCVVPAITAQRRHVARRRLRRYGCRLGPVRHRPSRTVRRGRVISQRPRRGAVLPSRGRVQIVVSRGRRR
jgi:hypothetical protein